MVATSMKSVLVVLSGGQDSTTCLFWAKGRFKEVHAITFNYEQRHVRELESAIKVASLAKVSSHEILTLGPILRSTSPLVSKSQQVGEYTSAEELPGGVEPTFIPGRNALFLVLAANRAMSLGLRDIVLGVCEEDYGGYYDCRKEFIDLASKSLSFGLAGDADYFKVHTPLMHLTKKQTVETAAFLPGCLEALAYTHTCYKGEYPPCGRCHACILRARGFEQYALQDPLLVRYKAEKSEQERELKKNG